MIYLVCLSQPRLMYGDIFLLNRAIELHKQQNTVRVLICDSILKICSSNAYADRIICKWCIFFRKKLIKYLPKDIEVIYYSDFYSNENKSCIDNLQYNYGTVKDIKELSYNKVNIGYAAFSTYVSLTRNLYPVIDYDFKYYFDIYLKAECILIEVIKNALGQICPDSVFVYNARFIENRPILEMSKCLGYNIKNYGGLLLFDRFFIINFFCIENHMLHHVKSASDIIEKIWANSNLDKNEKLIIGNSFFTNKRNAVFAGDQIYTKDQQLGVLPIGFDQKKRNITIFMSSEDEFASIDKEYDDNKLFPSQYDGIMEIINSFRENNDFHFYLRIHPNLKGIKYKYHTCLLDLDGLYSNLTIIKADAVVSSYSLLDYSEKIIVFGSTIGLEATYWGKPVLSLATASYDNLNVAYKPQTKDELFLLLATENLPAKGKSGAIKHGFYSMDTPKNDYDCFDTRYKIWHLKFMGKHVEIPIYNYKPVRYNSFIRYLLLGVLKLFAKIHLCHRIVIPKKEL